MKISKIEKENYKVQVQHLLPVLSKDCQLLLGMIQCAPIELDGSSITLSGRMFDVSYLLFEDLAKNIKRSIYCLVGYNCNGVDGFLPVESLGIFSIWSTPVMNPGYQRSTLGLVEFLTTSKFDHNQTYITSNTKTSEESQTEIVSATANVSISKFPSKFSFVEFDWVSVLNTRILKCKLKPCEFKSISVVQNDTPFKVIMYNNSATNTIPNILQIMRVNEVTNGSYEFVFTVEGSYEILFKLVLNVK